MVNYKLKTQPQFISYRLTIKNADGLHLVSHLANKCVVIVISPPVMSAR